MGKTTSDPAGETTSSPADVGPVGGKTSSPINVSPADAAGGTATSPRGEGVSEAKCIEEVKSLYEDNKTKAFTDKLVRLVQRLSDNSLRAVIINEVFADRP